MPSKKDEIIETPYRRVVKAWKIWIGRLMQMMNRDILNQQIQQVFKLEPKELVLVYFYCPDIYKDKQFIKRFKINGKTSLIKQIFLLQKETDLFKNRPEIYKFVPYKYGPHSWELFHDLDSMVNSKLLKTTQYDSRGPIEYILTEKGKELAQKKWKEISREDRIEIFKIKNTYNNWSLNDILSYVYDNYPEYIGKSEIREKILGT